MHRRGRSLQPVRRSMAQKFSRLVVAGVMAALFGIPAASAQSDERYRLQSNDVLELDFPFVPSFNQTLTVQPDGYVTVHARGPLHVQGLTLAEATDALRAEYASILRDPVIAVRLKEFEKPYFVVAG